MTSQVTQGPEVHNAHYINKRHTEPFSIPKSLKDFLSPLSLLAGKISSVVWLLGRILSFGNEGDKILFICFIDLFNEDCS